MHRSVVLLCFLVFSVSESQLFVYGAPHASPNSSSNSGGRTTNSPTVRPLPRQEVKRQQVDRQPSAGFQRKADSSSDLDAQSGSRSINQPRRRERGVQVREKDQELREDDGAVAPQNRATGTN